MHDASGQSSLQGQPKPSLDDELEQARRHGRWLAEEEIAALEQQRLDQIQRLAQQRQNRRKLLLLTVVCVLLPPLWPLALGLVLYQLFPQATRRYGLIAGLVLLGIVALVAVLLFTVLMALLVALF